ncbi:uncharacterized protein TM35_000141810 [Trypanosoma theileri]|uniref:Uncharacterized protein n=1 Tax=Trypanosoma theileri TaxID=67003 RepID=A0A1X0NXU3_9TRYP|nr:uncharacterized protein TM35_000141810 [Trypanosoma theileri]ORC88970.1 hypothetical protein TM35_000141810 [Trypanosoma theileri]
MLDGGGAECSLCHFAVACMKRSSRFLRLNDSPPNALHLHSGNILNRFYCPRHCAKPSSHLNMLRRHPFTTNRARSLQKIIPCLVIIWERVRRHGKNFSRHAVTNWLGDTPSNSPLFL